MAIVAGDPVVTLPTNWWKKTLEDGTVMSLYPKIDAGMGTNELAIGVVEHNPQDGHDYYVNTIDVVGPTGVYMPDDALAGALNYCAISGQTNWTDATGDAWLAATNPAIAATQLKKWFVDKIVPEILTTLNHEYPMATSTTTPPATGTSTTFLDVMVALLGSSVITRNADGTFSIAVNA